MEFTPFTEEEYNAKYNVQLASLVEQGSDESSNVTTAITQACDDIIEFIETEDGGTFDKEDLTTEQNDIVNLACMYQLTYILQNGYFKHKSGFDAVSNTVVKMPDPIDADAKKLLRRKIIYRGRV